MAVKIIGKQQGHKPEPKGPVKAKRSRKKITNLGYSADTYARLFEFVAAGEDLSKACRHQGMPHPATVRRRMLVDDQLADQFKTAQAIRLHGLADELVSLPDEAIKGYEKVSAADRLTAAKQKADNIKWVLQRGLAEYAGIGEEGQAVTLNIINSPDVAPAAGAAPYVPAGQPVLKIVGGATKATEGSDERSTGEAGNG
ncbi:terminase small subunit-like protein [Caballeronia sp. KNU42]